MNIEEIDKWLDNEYGVSYTRLDELLIFYFERYTDKKEEIERLTNIINELEKWLHERANTETESEKNGYFNPSILRERATLNLVYDYLQELKNTT